MSKRNIRSLKAIEDYTETTMRPCQTCHNLICVGDPAVLVVYIADPKFKTGLDELDKEFEEDGSYLFHHNCRDCGEIAKVKYNVQLS